MHFLCRLSYSLGVPFPFKTSMTVGAAAIACLASAQQHHWYVSAFGGQSVIVFGSSDPRMAHGAGIGYNFGERARLRWGKKKRGELLGEIYYDYTKSNGVKAFPANSSSAYGLLALARYTWRPKDAPDSFLDIGWGVQFLSRSSHDLQSKINSTPCLDFGIILGKDHPRATVGARFMHISNAHTVGANEGQNQVYLLIQVPF